MIQILKNSWAKYKKQETWKKALLFVPVVILAILCVALFFIRPKSDIDKIIDAEKYNKKQVDAQISANKKSQNELKQLDERVIQKQQAIKKKIKEHHERAKELNNDIDTAVSDGDADKLKRLHAKLNSKSKCR